MPIQSVKPETPATLPTNSGRYSTLLPGNYFPDTIHAMGDGMISAFNTYVAACHLVSDSGRRARPQIGIEHQIPRLTGDA